MPRVFHERKIGDNHRVWSRLRGHGLEFWLVATPFVALHPRSLELAVAWPLLGVVVLVCTLAAEWPASRLLLLVAGLSAMTPLSLWLPTLGLSPWWSMTVPLGAALAVAGLRVKPLPLWSVALFWVLAIGLVSGGSGGAGGWGDWFARLLGITSEQADTVVWWIRKGIHFFYYGGMAALLVRVLAHDKTTNPVRAAALWCLGIAAFDESRQLFTPFRSGSAVDFLLDAAGIATFLWLWSRRTRSDASCG